MGRSPLQPWVEFVGNDVSLDFVNTLNAWSAPTSDQFADVDGLAAWADAAGLRPAGGEALTVGELERARHLRTSLQRLLAAVVDGDPLPAEAERTVLELAAEATRHAALTREDDHLRPGWADAAAGDAIVWQVADAALSLLRTGDLSRLGRCPGCGWLFLDVTKNRSRRWCSMATCGSREKARRYYRRHDR